MKLKTTSVLLALVMLLSCVLVSNLPVNAIDTAKQTVSSKSTGPQSKIQGSAILHCFDWSYNSIKNNLSAIKAAGYTAVQTSPVQPAKDYNGNWRDQSGQWWKLYQPLGIRISGSNQTWLGSKDELKSLCTTAESMGIKVIVDVVANHVANKQDGGGYGNVNDAVDSELKRQDYYHSSGDWANDGSRWSVTQGHIGMPDLNTGHSDIQGKFKSFLQDCVAQGVDGFRFDAAKHIELPTDDGCGSQFWPTVLGGVPNAYSYGEILNSPGGGCSISNYTTYMSVTDNNAGDYRLKCACDKNAQGLASSSPGDGKSGLAPNKSVLWVESHDTYMGNSGSAGIKKTNGVDNSNIVKAWAMVGSRAECSALYFARPAANMGDASTDTTWKSTPVAEVNKFKNYFDGESEYLSSQGDCAYNERGTTGVVISKLNGSGSVSLTAHKMKDGQYKDWVSGGTFNVSGGKISGNVGASGVAVVYNATTEPEGPSVSINFNGGNNGGNFYGSTTVTLYAANVSSATYKLGNDSAKSYTTGTNITIGAGMNNGESINLVLTGTGNGKTVTQSYTFTKKARPSMSGNTVVFYDDTSTKWGNVCAYVYASQNDTVINNAGWPGASMTNLGDNLWGYVIDDSKFPNANVIFAKSDGSAQHNGHDEPGLPISKGQWKIYSNGSWQDYPKPEQPTQQTQATNPTSSGATYYYGDINCDKKVNINDVTYIQFNIIGIAAYSSPSALGKILGDVDGNGKIKIQDANLIQQKLAGITSAGNKTGTAYVDPSTQPTTPTYTQPQTQATQQTSQSGTVTIYFDNTGYMSDPFARCFIQNYNDHTDYNMQYVSGSIFKVTIPSSFKKVEFRYDNGNQCTSWYDIVDGKTYYKN